jgi:formylglycine-generating enzyme required for sulfatase activity
VGSLRPNDLGLFDMLGNVMEWCQGGTVQYPAGTEERPAGDRAQPNDVLGVKTRFARILRGGSFNSQAWFVRSAFRGADAPTVTLRVVGFRPARTVP